MFPPLTAPASLVSAGLEARRDAIVHALRTTTAMLTGYIRVGLGAGQPMPPTQTLALKDWIRSLRGAPRPTSSVIIFACRNPTWVEWSIYCACWMRKLGHAPVLAFYGSDWERMFAVSPSIVGLRRLATHPRFIETVATIPDIELVDLEKQDAATAQALSSYDDFAQDYAHTVAAYDLHVEEHDPGDAAVEYEEAITERATMLRKTAADFELALQGIRLKKEREGRPVSHVVVYSGLIGPSPGVHEAASRLGFDVVSIEGWAVRPGHMLCNLNRPSMEYNIEGWMATLRAEGIDASVSADELARVQSRTEETPIDWVGDMHRVQRSPANAEWPEDLRQFASRYEGLALAATNVVGDSATLRRATIFQSQRVWLEELAAFFSNNQQWGLIIRAHPDEEWITSKVRQRMGTIAQAAADGVPNVKVIHGRSDLNTYSILPKARCALVWMSTLGVDAVLRGVPAVAAAKPKYSGLGAVVEPASKQAYFDTLRDLLTATQKPTDEQVRRAAEYLRITVQEFSYDAFSKDYRGRRLRLEGHRRGGEADTFYRIVARQLPPESRPRTRPSPGQRE